MNAKPMLSSSDFPLPALLSVKQVAVRLNVSKRTVWRLVSSGELIQPIKIGGSTRWRQAEVDAWIAGYPSV